MGMVLKYVIAFIDLYRTEYLIHLALYFVLALVLLRAAELCCNCKYSK